MQEIFDPRAAVDGDARSALLAKRNGPGAARFFVHTTLLAVTVLAVVLGDPRAGSSPLPLPLWGVSFLAASFFWATIFAPTHESIHHTIFRAPLLNDIVTWVYGVPQLLPPALFRELHWAHHRHTHDPQRDPEIMLAPDMLVAWPKNPLIHLGNMSGVGLLSFKAFLVVAAPLGPPVLYARVMPWVRPEKRLRVRAHAAVVLLLWCALAALGVLVLPGLLWCFAIVVVAHAILSPMLIAEHTGLPPAGDVFARTRTISTTWIVRYFMWNMPYHAEHHAWPGVPFFALPQLHAVLRERLVHAGRGYLQIHLEALSGAPRRERDQA